MCLSPLTLPNPHVSCMYTYSSGTVKPSDPRLYSHKPYIQVPCGKCLECVTKRYNDLLQRVYVESLSSYVFLITLTYNQSHVPVFRFTASQRVKIRRHFRRFPFKGEIYYADQSHIQDMFKRIRKLPLFESRDFRYLAVSEYGSERLRPHFHILFFVGRRSSDANNYPDLLESELSSIFKTHFSINVGTRKFPVYESLFDDVSKVIDGKTYSTFTCSLIRPKDSYGNYYTADCSVVAGTVGKYVLSYVTKESRFEEYVSTWFPYFESAFGKSSLQSLKRLLTCYCSYSHQLGFGFDFGTGRRVVPSSDISLHLTQSMYERYLLYYSLPERFKDFVDLYPELSDSYKAFSDGVACGSMVFVDRSFGSLHLFLDMHPEVLTNLLIASKYEPSLVLSFLKLNRFESRDSSLLDSVLFRNSCKLQSSYVGSISYKYLTTAVESSINCAMVSFCVPVHFSNGDRYFPMCSYYKKYFVRDEHVLRLYDRLGVSDYDEYLSLVVSSCDKVRLSKTSVNRSYVQCQEKKSHFIWSNLAKMPNLFAFNKKISIFAPDIEFFEKRLPYESSYSFSEVPNFSFEDSVHRRCRRIRSIVDRFIDGLVFK